MITQTELKEIIHYAPCTGTFTWLVSRGNRCRGSEAGTRRKDPTCYNLYYRVIRYDGKNYRAHRLAWLYMLGHWPNKTDHEDGNGLNNRWSNLRDGTTQLNNKNKAMQSNNTSGCPGVCFHKRTGKWQAQIGGCGRKNYKYLGLFINKDDAVRARRDAERAAGFHPNHGRLK